MYVNRQVGWHNILILMLLLISAGSGLLGMAVAEEGVVQIHVGR